MSHKPHPTQEAGVAKVNLHRCPGCGEGWDKCQCERKKPPTFQEIKDSIPQEDRGV